MKKRALSLFLAWALCLTMLPAAALADEEPETDTPLIAEETTQEEPEQQEEAPAVEEPTEDTPAAEEPAPQTGEADEPSVQAATHQHYLSGYGFVDFEPWTDEAAAALDSSKNASNSLPRSGKYYLTKDVTLETTLYVNRDGDLSLCLNGHTITSTATYTVFQVTSYGVAVTKHTLNIYDCQGTGIITRSEGYPGAGVEVETSTDTFNMYGGTITGCTNGVSVNKGTFKMYGGTIRDNTCNGVYTTGETAKATISNATITGNRQYGIYAYKSAITLADSTVTGNGGGGVVLSNTSDNASSLTVGGLLKVYGNTDNDGNECNVNLNNACETYIQFTSVSSALKEGSIIGVTKHCRTISGTGGNTVYGWVTKFTNSGASNYAQYFFGDNEYTVYTNGTALDLKTGDNTATHYHMLNGELTAFTPWTGETLPDSGHYYLTKDMTVSATWHPEEDLALCLNDHDITSTGEGPVVAIDAGKNVTLIDCHTSTDYYGMIKHKTASQGTGIEIAEGGTLVMNGGEITSNVQGVVNQGTFEMRRGYIYYNSGDKNGAGVYNAGNFIMVGSEIAYNKLTSSNGQGAGVYNNGDMTVSGSAKIYRNSRTTDSAQSNLFVPSGHPVTVDAEGLTTSTNIWLSADNTVLAVKNVTDTDEARFTSDSGDYSTTYSDGNLYLYAGALHKHPLCGADCSDSEKHSDEVWLPISTEAALRAINAAGNYYLTDDISLTTVDADDENNDEKNTWKPVNGVNLCLNGHTLSMDAYGGTPTITLESGVTFKLSDCDGSGEGKGRITHGSPEGSDDKYTGSGVDLDDGTFYLYGGAICGNESTVSGGGGIDMSDGTLYMYGGAICGNNGANSGGGIFMHNGKVYAYGGEIKNNTVDANKTGGGAYLLDGDFYAYGVSIHGNAITSAGANPQGAGIYIAQNGNAKLHVKGGTKIYDNLKDGWQNNVYLPYDFRSSKTFSRSIIIEGALTDEARIGVTTQLDPHQYDGDGGMAAIAANLNDANKENYATIFSADEAATMGYTVILDGTTVKINGHEYTWEYTANGNTITATCTNTTNCPLASKNYVGGTYTLNAQASKPVYNGSVQELTDIVTTTINPGASGLPDAEILCKQGGEKATFLNAGTYQVSIKVGETESDPLPYTIDKATLTAADFIFTAPSNLVYDGTDKVVPITSNVTDGKIVHSFYNEKGDLCLPKAPGKYTVTISVKEGTNFAATTKDLEDPNWTFEIKKGTQTVTVPTGKTVINNSASVDINGWATAKGVTGGEPAGKVTYALDDNSPTGVTLNDTALRVAPTVAAGTTITVKATAKGTDYYNEATETFTVTVANKTPAELEVTQDNWTYSGAAVPPTYTAPDGVIDSTISVTYTKRGESTFSDTVPTAAGDYTVKVTLETSDKIYTGTENFRILAKSLTAAMVADIAGQTYNGTPHTPDVTVTDGDTPLVADTDYTVAYENNQNAGEATAKITGKGNYQGTVENTFTISPKGLSSESIMLNYVNSTFPTYTGEDIALAFRLIDGAAVLTAGKDYKIVSGGSGTDAGSYTLTIKGIGNYAEQKTLDWKILAKAVTNPTIEVTGDLTYTGAAITPTVVLTDPDTGKVIPTSEYTVEFRDNINVTDNPVVTIKNADGGNYVIGTNGETSGTFQIQPKAVTVAAANKSAYVGDKAAPALPNEPVAGTDYTISGLVGEDTLSGTVSLAYDGTPDLTKAGEIAIKITGTLANANYAVTYTDGKLIVSTRPSSGGGGGSSSTPKYAVTVPSGTAGGSVKSNVSTAASGSTVTITVTPADGYKLDGLTVTDSKGNSLKLTDKGNGQFSFTMPNSKVDVKPTFVKDDTAEQPSYSGYIDVADSAWYADAVQYVTKKGLMGGTGDSKFSPALSTTRGMLMTVLARYAGADTTGSNPWYQKGMDWAKANGVSDGTNPNVNITREQLVTMLYRYAGSPAANGSLDSFADADTVSSYAVSAMRWAVAEGIIGGSNGKLNPQNYATRAEVAAILMRFCEKNK